MATKSDHVLRDEAFAAGAIFARAEGTILGPESTHAMAGAVACAGTVTEREFVLIGLLWNGILDLPAHES